MICITTWQNDVAIGKVLIINIAEIDMAFI